MKKRIAVISGDGIGPEVVSQSIRVLDEVGKKAGCEFEYKEFLAGGISIDKFGVPLKDEVVKECKTFDAVLLGAVGGPKWDNVDSSIRPEKALLGLRGGLNLYCNLRPAVLFPELVEACPLKESIVKKGFDITIVRELTGGLYFGKKERAGKGQDEYAYDTMYYSRKEIDRILKIGFETAKKRNKHLTLVDKANILSSSQLWRDCASQMAKDYKDITLDYLYVDNASMQLVVNPCQFDVIVTENTFGDILSDEASMITGSIGLLASASLGDGKFGLYEPIHGTAPDIAGKGIANPIATILSVAMMLKYSLDMPKEADRVEKAVHKALGSGARTGDLAKLSKGDGKVLSTKDMTDIIIKNL